MGLQGQLTYLLDGVFLILKHHSVCPVHRGLESVLLAEEVEELGGAELVPPLIWSRAVAQVQEEDETLQGHMPLYPTLAQHCPPFTFTVPFLIAQHPHFTSKETAKG